MAKFGIFKICKKPNKKPSHISYYGVAVSSIYWNGEDENGKYLIRCSKHWSAFIRSNGEVKLDFRQCGMIKNSFFILKGKANIIQRPICGKIYLKNFKKINKYGVYENGKFSFLLW